MHRSIRLVLTLSVAAGGLVGAGLAHAGTDGVTVTGAVRAAAMSAVAPSRQSAYTVRPGDSLWAISRRFDVGLSALLTANGLSLSSVIHPHQTLVAPAGSGGSAPTAPSPPRQPSSSGSASYTVRPGDSLYGIARRLGVSVTSLLAANRLVLSSVIHPGELLAVPAATTAPPTTPSSTTPSSTTPTSRPPARPAPPATGTYTIRAGDSLYAISRRLGVSFSALLAANGLAANSLILPGQRLTVPTGAPTPAPAPTPPATAPGTVGTAEAERIIREVWPDHLEQMAVDIARRESGLRPTAQNGCCVGLFQLYYDLHSWWLADMGITSRGALFDARSNARAALALYQRAGWTPWAVAPGS